MDQSYHHENSCDEILSASSSSSPSTSSSASDTPSSPSSASDCSSKATCACGKECTGRLKYCGAIECKKARHVTYQQTYRKTKFKAKPLKLNGRKLTPHTYIDKVSKKLHDISSREVSTLSAEQRADIAKALILLEESA